MDFSAMLRPEFLCECGRVHTCDTRAIYVGKNAVEKLPEFLRGHRRVLVVSDLNTRRVSGGAAVETLAKNGFAVTEACFETTDPVEPDEQAAAFLESRTGADVEAIVGVGGGVMNDLTKLLAASRGVPNLYLCTAPSMDGIATNTSVLTRKGLKYTVAQQAPRWIAADIDVLRSAPMRMIRAGLGDVLGKYSALNDWRLSHLLTGEMLCESVWRTVSEALMKCAESIDAIMRREEAGIAALTESLILIGIAAGYVLVSRPGSGAEHLMGHYFEIHGQLHGAPFFSHGENVGHCALIVERLRTRLAAEDPSRFAHRFDRAAWVAGVRRLFPQMAEEIIAMQDGAGTHADRAQLMARRWDDIRAILAQTPGPEALSDQLRRAGFDEADFRRMYGEAHIRDAIRYCGDLKVKHTLFQLLADTGLLEEYARTVEV